MVSFPQVSPPNPCIHLSSFALRAPPISFFSILSPEQYWVWITNNLAPCYVLFSTPVTTSLIRLNISLSTLFSNTLSLLSSLNVSDQVSHPHKTAGKIKLIYILIHKCLCSKQRGKVSGQNYSSHSANLICKCLCSKQKEKVSGQNYSRHSANLICS